MGNLIDVQQKCHQLWQFSQVEGGPGGASGMNGCCAPLPAGMPKQQVARTPNSLGTLAGSSLLWGHSSWELSTGSGAASTPPLAQPSSQASGTKRPRSPAQMKRPKAGWAGCTPMWRQVRERAGLRAREPTSQTHAMNTEEVSL